MIVKKPSPAVRHQLSSNPHFCAQSRGVCVSLVHFQRVWEVIQHILTEGGHVTAVAPRALSLSFLSWSFSAPVNERCVLKVTRHRSTQHPNCQLSFLLTTRSALVRRVKWAGRLKSAHQNDFVISLLLCDIWLRKFGSNDAESTWKLTAALLCRTLARQVDGVSTPAHVLHGGCPDARWLFLVIVLHSTQVELSVPLRPWDDLTCSQLKPLLITYILLEGPRGARLNAPGLWRPSRRWRFRTCRGVRLCLFITGRCAQRQRETSFPNSYHSNPITFPSHSLLTQ